MSDISKDLKDQPKFQEDIGSKGQDHHTFEIEKQNTLKKIQNFLHGNPTMVPVIILILSVVTFGLIAGGKFFSAFNLSLIIQQVTIVGILAAAQTLIILTAGNFSVTREVELSEEPLSATTTSKLSYWVDKTDGKNFSK